MCLPFVLSACGTPGMLKQTDELVSAAKVAAESAMEADGAKPTRLVERLDEAWISRRSIAIASSEALPDRFNRPARFHTGRALPLSIIVGQVARAHALTIRVAADVACDGGGAGGGRGEDGARSGAAGKTFTVTCTDAGEPAVPLNYSGTLNGLLDAVAHRSGTHWTYRNGVVEFSRLVTRTFQIKTMPGTTRYAASVGKKADMQAQRGASGGSSGGSSSGMQLTFGADAQVSMSSDLDYWADLAKTVGDMLSSEGRVTPSTVTSTLVVTDTADVIERVARFIESENAVLGRQVKLRVQVYSVNLSEDSASGIDWNLVFKTASGFTASMAGPGIGALKAARGGIKLHSIPGGGRLAGSNAMIRALSQQGRTSTVIDTTVVTLNNQPAPVAVTNNRGFVAETKMTVGSLGSVPVVTAQQSMLTTGFVMNLLPTLLDNRSVLLQVQIDMSNLNKLEKFNIETGDDADSDDDDGPSASVDLKNGKVDIGGDSDKPRRKRRSSGGTGSFVQLPDTSSVQTMQRASLKSGDTLVLSGFRRKEGRTERDGLFMYEGGTKSAKQGDQEVVIVISPELTEGV